MYCEGCERSVPIQLRTATQAECSICKELVFDAEAEAALPIDGDEGEAFHCGACARSARRRAYTCVSGSACACAPIYRRAMHVYACACARVRDHAHTCLIGCVRRDARARASARMRRRVRAHACIYACVSIMRVRVCVCGWVCGWVHSCVHMCPCACVCVSNPLAPNVQSTPNSVYPRSSVLLM